MNDTQGKANSGEVERAIVLAEAALAQCDKAGLIWPAIDISCALDKLRVLRENNVNH